MGGFGQGKISGHSGTEFKHRKGFAAAKEFYRKWKPKQQHRSNEGGRSMKEVLQLRKTRRWIEFKNILKLLIPIILLTALLLSRLGL